MNYRIEEYTEGGPARNATHSVAGGRSTFGKWFDDLDPGTAARVDRYIRRMEAGNFGAAKALRGGVYELRLYFGPGYRVYYGVDGKTLVILLGGGDKRRQDADINAAAERWKRYKKEKACNGPDARL